MIERLVRLRDEAGLTQAGIAARLGTSQPVIARIEAGGRNPRLSTLERYARAVGAQVEVRRSKNARAGRLDKLAHQVEARLSKGDESMAGFREVIQFLDDTRSMTDSELTEAVRSEPLSTTDPRWDALIAAAADWAASTRDLAPPPWTRSSRRRLKAPGWVLTPYTRLHKHVRRNTPVEFARHGVFVERDSLVSV